MAVLWGLDLNEIHYSKFKSSYMWNDRYHLRRTKFIVYQLAMILCVVSESLGTAALSDYLDQQKVAKQVEGATIHNNDIVGVFSYNIFAGVFVAFIFGGAFFFDLIWPERSEDRGIRIAWKYSAVAACLFEAGAAFATTVVVGAHKAYISGASPAEAAHALASYKKSSETPLNYRKNGRAVAAVVFIWPGFLATIASTILLWKSINYIEQHGALAAHVRNGETDAKRDIEHDCGTATDGTNETHGQHEKVAEPQHNQGTELHNLVQGDRVAEPNYNVATASTLNGTKRVV